MRPFPLICLLFVAACASDLVVPEPPTAPQPRIDAFSPANAWAGMDVTLTGAFLGTRGSTVRVAFGEGAEVAATQDGDGTRLVVRVPESATSGTIRVSTPSGDAVSADGFVFRGADRLRGGVVAATADLRPTVWRADPLGQDGRALLTFASFGVNGAAMLGADGSLTLREGALVAVAAVADEVASIRTDVACGATGVDRPSLQLESATGQVLAAACLVAPGAEPSGELHAPIALAVSPDARYAAAVSRDAAWLVDFTGTMPAVRLKRAVSAEFLDDVAWRSEGRFVYLTASSLGLLDAASTDDGAEWKLPAGTLATSFAVEGHLAAVGTDDGYVKLVDTFGWPPVVVQTLDTLERATVNGLAIGQNGRRAFASQYYRDHVVAFDLANRDSVPFASLTIPAPEQLLVRDDLVYLGVTGGYALLSADRGALLADRRVHSTVLQPTIRTLTTGGVEKQVVEVMTRDMRTLNRLNAETLSTSFPLGRRLPCAPVASATDVWGPDLFILCDDRVLHDAGGATTKLDELSLPRGTFTSIAVAPGGKAVFVTADAVDPEYPEGFDPEGRVELYVLDPSRPAGQAVTLHLSLPGGGAYLTTANDTNVAVVTNASLTLLDWHEALAGRTKQVAQEERDLSHAAYRLADAVLVSRATRRYVMSLADGTITEHGPFPEHDAEGAASSPSGRHVHWLRDTAGSPLLGGAPVDPVSGAPLDLDPVVPLPRTARFPVVYPDGERVLVVDDANDGVLLVR